MSACCRCRSNVRPAVTSSETVASDLDGRSSSIDMAALDRRTDEMEDRLVEGGSTERSTKSLRASICLKLTIFVGFLVVLAAGAPALVLWLKAHEQLVAEIERRLFTVSTLRQEQLLDYLQSESVKTELITSRVLINKYLVNKTVINRSLAEFDLATAVEVISDFVNAAIYDSQGELSLATDSSMFENNMLPSDLSTINSKGLRFDPPVRKSTGWMYTVTRAMYQNHTLIGAMMTWVNATPLANLVYDRTGLQTTGEILVGVPEGPSLVHLLFPPRLAPNLTLVHRGGAMVKAIEGQSGITTLTDYKGDKVIAAYRPVGFLHWGLLAKLDVTEAYAPVRSVRAVIIIAIVILLFLGVMASLILAKVFTSPIVELGRAAAALGQGDMRTRAKKGTVLLRDEIADLMDTFNSMAQQIASHHLILEHKVTERTWDLARANEGLAKEVEERKKIEIELEKAKDVAVAANRSKSEFLANMSHEIRTPLNAIINFTELCLDTRITPEQQEHLDYVRFAAQHLLRLITDILDFSKIEAGKLEMEEIQFSLFDQLEHAVSVLAARALKNGLELCCRFDPNVPDQIMGDPGRLLQIFVNLIGNGIKFTKKGEVVVSVSVRDKTVDTVELLFAVKDTGLGIPQSKQTMLFQAFSQVDSSTQRVYGGTGLGLVISSKLAAAMGGKMWVESDGLEDHGSTFKFTAGFHIPPACYPSLSANVDMFKDVLALVVDDNVTSLGILVDLLKNWGMKADGASSVEAAKVALQKASEFGKKYKVLLLNMWLKGTNAIELVKFIRERPRLLGSISASVLVQQDEKHNAIKAAVEDSSLEAVADEVVRQRQDHLNKNTLEDGVDPELPPSLQHSMEPNLLMKFANTSSSSSSSQAICQDQIKGENAIIHQNPRKEEHFSVETVSSSIVMLTSVNLTDATRCKELGLSIHTSKPVKRSLLARALQQALGAQQNPTVPDGKGLKDLAHNPSKSLHILVAEDNIVNQRVAVILLQKWGHTTVLARNGAEAVEQATKEAFDLILMDVQMPICDGFEATAKIRELEKARDKGGSTPIVAMTAHAMSGDGERCIAAGMDFYISKPLNAKKLQELLQSVATGHLEGSIDSSSVPSAVST